MLTINSMLISMFCTNCECEIVFVLIYGTGRTISGSQNVQNTKKSTKNLTSNFNLMEETMKLSAPSKIIQPHCETGFLAALVTTMITSVRDSA